MRQSVKSFTTRDASLTQRVIEKDVIYLAEGKIVRHRGREFK